MPGKPTIPRTCDACGRPFLTAIHTGRPLQRFCSVQCNGRNQLLPRNQAICAICGREFFFYSAPTAKPRRYCGVECGKAGRKHTAEITLANALKRLDRSNPDGCWAWTGYRNDKGYGGLSAPGKRWVYAHRFFYKALVGPIPSETPCVLHRCDNPPCCNPAHLFLGTIADNNADMAAKGRSSKKPVPPERRQYGERHHHAKLTDHQVREIRRRVDQRTESHATIAKDFGISASNVGLIGQRKAWAHVK